MLGAIYLYRRNGPNDRWIAVFGATFGMIQLAEFFMWSDLGCGKMNKYASMFALLILAAEPLMNMVGGIYFSNSPDKKILRYMLLAYICFILFMYFTQIRGKPRDWCGTSLCQSNPNIAAGFSTDKMCNLEWYFTNGINPKMIVIWVLFLMLPLLAMTPKMYGIVIFTLGFAMLAISSLANNAAQGSIWCWLAVGLIYGKILFLK
jgi:hypothetical protein